MQCNSEKLTVAAFDFDGTITTRDSLLPFLRFVVGYRKFVVGIIHLFPVLVKLKFGMVTSQVAKEAFFTYYLKGYSIELLAKKGEEFAYQVLPSMVRSAMLERLRWHKSQHHICLLVSASPSLYLKPWAAANGFEAVLATELETTLEGFITGKICGNNCKGAEKTARILQWAKGKVIEYLYAYGDSNGDSEMLGMANVAYYRKWIFENEDTINMTK